MGASCSVRKQRPPTYNLIPPGTTVSNFLFPTGIPLPNDAYYKKISDGKLDGAMLTRQSYDTGYNLFKVMDVHVCIDGRKCFIRIAIPFNFDMVMLQISIGYDNYWIGDPPRLHPMRRKNRPPECTWDGHGRDVQDGPVCSECAIRFLLDTHFERLFSLMIEWEDIQMKLKERKDVTSGYVNGTIDVRKAA